MQRISVWLLMGIMTMGWSQDFPEAGKCNAARSAAKWLNVTNVMTPAQESVDMAYYRLNLTIHPETQTIDGTVVVRATVLDSGLSQLDLNLADNLSVASVTIADTAVSYTHSGNLLAITLPPQSEDAQVEAVIEYSGTPDPNGFGSFVFSSRNGNDHIWSLSEPYGARDWWPCKDDPSDKADSVDIIITVPGGLVVASNGLLDRTATGNDGTTTYYWKERYPIATYLVSVAIYPYSVWNDTYVGLDTTQTMPLQFFSYPDHVDQLENNYLRIKDMLHAYAQRYGEYPFLGEKYGHAEFGWGGGMEHQTITSLGGWGLDLLSHELAHQWWGDMVTCADFHHIWLNEGFATYSQAIWWESQDGPTGYHNFINTRRYYGAGTVYVEEPNTVGEIFDYNLSYAKGAWVLHMLRHVVGDSTFFEILQTYGSDPQFRYHSATTEQFRDVCESVSGMDLHQFFQQWIYESYFPRYTVGYQQTGDTLQVEIGQSSTGGTIFTMPIDLEIQSLDSVFTVVVQNSASSETYTIQLPQGFQVQHVVLDPDQWILRQVQYIPMNTGGEALPSAWSLSPAYPNPFNSRVSFPYALGERAEVDFTIFDLAGKEVVAATFVQLGGNHEFIWNGTDSFGRTVSGGVYLVRFRAGNYSQTEKVVFLK